MFARTTSPVKSLKQPNCVTLYSNDVQMTILEGEVLRISFLYAGYRISFQNIARYI